MNKDQSNHKVPNLCTHSDSRNNIRKAHIAATSKFRKQFDDEITIQKGDQFEILAIDKTKTMIKVTNNSVIGWISRIGVTENDLKATVSSRIQEGKADSWVHPEVPQRIEQLYRQRRIAHMLEKIKGIKQENRKIAAIKNDKRRQFFTAVTTTIQPHHTKIIHVRAKGENLRNFYMIEPNENYIEHEEFEVLDGSYYKSKGGYMIARNITNTAKRIPKGTYIGDGLEIELEDLPFMDSTTISLLSMSETN